MWAHDIGMTLNVLNHHLSQYQAAVVNTGIKLFNIFQLLGYNIIRLKAPQFLLYHSY